MVRTLKSIRKAAAASRPGDNLCLLKEGLFSDFKIQCGEFTFDVHRVFMFQGSKYFKLLTTSSFKEVKDAKVEFKDDKPAVVARMIYFLYTGRCSIDEPLSDLGIKQFDKIDETMYVKDKPLYLAQMYAIATRLAVVDFSRLIACEFAVVFDLPGEGEHEWTEWLGLVTYIYKSTPSTARDLRNRVVVIWQSAVSGLSAGEFLHNDMLELLQATLQETPRIRIRYRNDALGKKLLPVLAL